MNSDSLNMASRLGDGHMPCNFFLSEPQLKTTVNWRENLNFKLRIALWNNFFFLGIWRSKQWIEISEKKPPLHRICWVALGIHLRRVKAHLYPRGVEITLVSSSSIMLYLKVLILRQYLLRFSESRMKLALCLLSGNSWASSKEEVLVNYQWLNY